MHLVEANGRRVLLDCGLFQGRRAEARERNKKFPFRPKDVDAVVLSHAHIDHCGNLPNLVRMGFEGPIYTTPASQDLAAVMLADSAKIQEEDAAYLNRKRERGEPPVQPLYTAGDAEQAVSQIRPLPYGKVQEIGERMQLRFSDAGHLLGSAVTSLTIGGGGRERTVTFTGDLGRRGLPILRDPEPLPSGDLVISESTYGGRRHEPIVETSQKALEVVKRTVERGGKVLIPAFSLGRTQTVVYYVHKLTQAGMLKDLPIFVDSPLSAKATDVFRRHPECFDEETAKLLAQDPDLFGEKRVTYTRSVDESKKLNERRDPCIIIASSGMCEAGRILHHLKHNVEDPRATIMSIGFQAPHTLGRRLVEKQPEVRVLDRMLKLRAEAEVLNGLSSHADHDDLLRCLGPLAGSAKQVALVHGEPESQGPLAQALREQGFQNVQAPARGQEIEIS
jgi:metallo-beta-lactamase family protein